jgi:hypothetical protein
MAEYPSTTFALRDLAMIDRAVHNRILHRPGTGARQTA